MRLRALIVDDERLARAKLRRLLADDRGVEIVGECADGASALAATRELAPDLLLLDVQMPGMSGFDVARELGPERAPAIVFITAHDAYAVRAFEIAAVDYLLKPFTRARLEQALERARRQLAPGAAPDLGARLEALLREAAAARPGEGRAERVLVRSGGKMTFLRVDEIEWVEAEDNYVCVHAGADAHLLRETLSQLEARLDPRRFVRIHRSYVINLDAVAEVRTSIHGDYEVAMRGGALLPVGRTFRERLLSAAGG